MSVHTETHTHIMHMCECVHSLAPMREAMGETTQYTAPIRTPRTQISVFKFYLPLKGTGLLGEMADPRNGAGKDKMRQKVKT